MPSTVLALSRCSYKSVGELRRVGRLGQGALCKGWPLCIRVKRGKFIAMVCVGTALAFALGDSERWKTSQSANGGSQARFSQLRFVVNNLESALSGSASLELQDEGDSAPGETNKLGVAVSVTQ